MNCPICQTEGIKVGVYCSGKHHPWYICSECGHKFLYISEEANSRFQANYRSKMQLPGDLRANGTLDLAKYTANRQGIKKARIGAVGGFLSARRRLLDVGCGGGYLLHHYKTTHEVCGIEVDKQCVAACEELGIACIAADFLETDAKPYYDVVMAWHVLEHSLHPVDFLRHMLAWTRVGGIVVVEIPVKRAMKSKYDGHPQCFSAESFQRLLASFPSLRKLRLQPGVQKPALLFVGEKTA